LPIVSVIMPAFNSEFTITDSINSVINQSFQDWELIIVDDNSTDNTPNVIEQFISLDSRIILKKLTTNNGVSNARNIGVSLSSSELIAFIDSDDLWSPDKLKLQVKYHHQFVTCKISHTDFSMFNQSEIIKTPLKKINSLFIKKRGNLFSQLLYTNCIGTLTVMVDRLTLLNAGSFDVELTAVEDQDLWLRISMIGHEFHYLNNVLSFYRVNSSGLSGNIGKVKFSYKKFLEKHKFVMIKHGKFHIAKAYYFRFMGVMHFSRRDFGLAYQYFKKCISLFKMPSFVFLIIPYLMIAYFKKS
jgi:teichuronic acid biosynthesis glycosyltransferase TuaG